jgi:hypothetical protein
MSLIVIAVLFALAWVFFVLPSRCGAAGHAAMQDEIEVGKRSSPPAESRDVREAGDDSEGQEIASSLVVTSTGAWACGGTDIRTPDPS